MESFKKVIANNTLILILLMLTFFYPTKLMAAPGKYFDFTYSQGKIHVWVPDSVSIFRAAIIHMHGGQSSGEGPQAIKDIHWQTLAAKWNAIFIAPEYGFTGCVYRASDGNSGADILASLDSLSQKYNHIEIKKLPFCVWGHSCGGYWATNFTKTYPTRTIACFPRSGMDDMSNNTATNQIPIYGNQSKKGTDLDDANINDFPKGRAKGLLWNLSIDPNGSHDCRDSRLMAIPLFDETMRQRLPDPKATADEVVLKPMQTTGAWLGDMTAPYTIAADAAFSGDKLTASWLPNQNLAQKWREYMQTGTVKDSTAPDAPYGLTDSIQGGKLVLRWQLNVDLESGITYSYIYRDGTKIGTLTWGHSDYGDAAGSHPDELRFKDDATPTTGKHLYQISQVNGSGIESQKASFNYPDGNLSAINKPLTQGFRLQKVERKLEGFTVKGETRNLKKSASTLRFSK